jgi:hypothetical protein
MTASKSAWRSSAEGRWGWSRQGLPNRHLTSSHAVAPMSCPAWEMPRRRYQALSLRLAQSGAPCWDIRWDSARPKLTAHKVGTLRDRGFYGDGDSLHLRIGPTGAKSRILRTVVHGKRRDLDPGATSLVSLAEARDKAREPRRPDRNSGVNTEGSRNPDAPSPLATPGSPQAPATAPRSPSRRFWRGRRRP